MAVEQYPHGGCTSDAHVRIDGPICHKLMQMATSSIARSGACVEPLELLHKLVPAASYLSSCQPVFKTLPRIRTADEPQATTFALKYAAVLLWTSIPVFPHAHFCDSTWAFAILQTPMATSNAAPVASTSLLVSTASSLGAVASSSAASAFQVWLTDYAPSTASAYLPLDTPCPRGLFASAFGIVYSSGCEFPNVDSNANRALCLCKSYSQPIVAAITNAATTRPSFCGQGVLATLAINSAAGAVNDLCNYLIHDASQTHPSTTTLPVSVTAPTTYSTISSVYSSVRSTPMAASAPTSTSSAIPKSIQSVSSTYTYTYQGIGLPRCPRAVLIEYPRLDSLHPSLYIGTFLCVGADLHIRIRVDLTEQLQ